MFNTFGKVHFYNIYFFTLLSDSFFKLIPNLKLLHLVIHELVIKARINNYSTFFYNYAIKMLYLCAAATEVQEIVIKIMILNNKALL